MPLSPGGAGALAATTVLFITLGVTHTKTIRGHPRLSALAFICGALVALGLIFLSPGFGAGVAQWLGGPSVALFIVWGVEISELRGELERRSATHMVTAFLSAAVHAATPGEDGHEYVDSLLRDGAIDEEQASVLHDQLALLVGVPRPRVL